MSLLTAYNTIVTSFEGILDDLAIEEVTEGIPDDPFNQGPALYIEPDVEEFVVSGMKRTITTSAVAVVVAIYIFEKPIITDGSSLLSWMQTKGKVIRDKIAADNAAGTYLADGDRGFAAYVRQIRFHFRPGDPTAGIRAIIQVESYQ